MKKLNFLVLICLILGSPLSSFAQKMETEVIKAFDGTAAHCKTKTDYIRSMRLGAYNIKEVFAELTDQQKIKLRILTQTLRCEHLGGESYAWKKTDANGSFEYSDLIFRDSRAIDVDVITNIENSRLAIISDEYKLLDEQKITNEFFGLQSANMKFDINQVLTASQMDQLGRGENVKLRIGVSKRADVSRTILGYTDQQNLGTQNWGTFYIFLNVTKDQDSLKVKVVK